jgi:hypothetical protein
VEGGGDKAVTKELRKRSWKSSEVGIVSTRGGISFPSAVRVQHLNFVHQKKIAVVGK